VPVVPVVLAAAHQRSTGKQPGCHTVTDGKPVPRSGMTISPRSLTPHAAEFSKQQAVSEQLRADVTDVATTSTQPTSSNSIPHQARGFFMLEAAA